MSTKTYGNKTTINIERQCEINGIMDGLSEDDPQYDQLMSELRELNVWHGDTVPDHVYHDPIFQEKIVPAQIKYIKTHTNQTATQIMPKLKRIARKFADF